MHGDYLTASGICYYLVFWGQIGVGYHTARWRGETYPADARYDIGIPFFG